MFRRNLKRALRNSGFSLCWLLCAATAFAPSITGVVTNKTTGKPAAGDNVTLIRLAQGMQEAGSTKTDARGRFTLQLPDDGVHLVRVTHDKANYFQPVVDPGQPVEVDVYTAAAKVNGVAAEAEVMRVQTDAGGKALTVVANFFVKNISTPPKTQFSDRPFEIYLPAGAVVEGSMALGPGKMSMPVKSAPVPLGDAPDHYAFIFPLRPCASKAEAAQDQSCGETRFQVSFRLPYSGSLAFAPKVATPTDTVAVMLPKSMTFKPAPDASFVPATDELNAQAFVARNVEPSQPLGFTVSGSGQLPRDTPAAGDGQDASGAGGGGGAAGGDLTPSEASARQRADTKPGVGLNTPLDSDAELEPWAKYKWWILGILGLALAGGAGVMLKASPAGGTSAGGAGAAGGEMPLPPAPVVFGPGMLLQVLKDELFAVETDHLEGRLNDAQYAEQKAALQIVLRRALGRSGDAGGTTAAESAEETPAASTFAP
jgi:hypothetical protein